MELDPISAVIAENPYGYYERLATDQHLSFDDALHWWVAAGAESVEAVLTNPALRVRPIAEPIPVLMRGTALATLFAQMIRMNDGPAHTELRAAMQPLVESLNVDVVGPEELDIVATPDALMFTYPSRAIAAMLGIARPVVAGVEHHARALARAIGPGATADDVYRADAAAKALDALFGACFGDARIRANAVALLFQGYDSLAGSIGHALYPHSDRRELAIHNTRRFAACETTIVGRRIQAGETVLVLLASAPQYAFGVGPHACVAAQIARRVIDAALRYAQTHIALRGLVRRGFLPLQNARIPVFA